MLQGTHLLPPRPERGNRYFRHRNLRTLKWIGIVLAKPDYDTILFSYFILPRSVLVCVKKWFICTDDSKLIIDGTASCIQR